jgi:hypothetical protein
VDFANSILVIWKKNWTGAWILPERKVRRSQKLGTWFSQKNSVGLGLHRVEHLGSKQKCLPYAIELPKQNILCVRGLKKNS